METQPAQEPLRGFMKSHTARFLMIGFITVLLILPLVSIYHLVEERKQRQQDVNTEIENSWGGPVTYYGIVLEVPMEKEETTTEVLPDGKTVEKKQLVRKTAWIYPEKSHDFIETDVSEKHKGIFTTQIFHATFRSRAVFNLKSLSKQTGVHIDWSAVRIGILTDANARYRKVTPVFWGDKELAISDQQLLNDDSLMISKTDPFAIDPMKALPEVSTFAAIDGTQEIRFQSLASIADLHLTSNWEDPSFVGSSLPTKQTRASLPEKGFSAHWNTFSIGKKPHAHIDELPLFSKDIAAVRFIETVDHYQLNERTIKYAILVIILTFAVFFLIEVIGKMFLHPLHYVMIGLALLLFYSLLLSFSEQIGFIPAYVIASLSITGLLFWYAKSVLKSLRFALTSTISLLLLYAFLLVIVNLEVYALIVGSLGLLAALAGIMSVTRRFQFGETTSIH